MGLNVGQEVAALQRMTVKQLKQKYAEVFGEDTNSQQQGVAGQADRLAAAGAGRGRPVRAGPPAGRRVGRRRRPAPESAAA